MGWNIGGHTHGNPGRTVGQQMRKGRGHNHGFFQSAVIIGAKIDGIFSQAVHQAFSNRRQPRLGISRCSRIIAVNIAKISLPINQRIAHIEILRQTRHRIINRGIPMRVIVAHHIARDFGRLAKASRRCQPQLAHRIKNAPMHRLQSVARIWQSAVHNG